MKKFISFLISSIIIGIAPLMAQTYKVANDASTLSVLGTSTLHDWKINAEKIEGSATISMKNNVLEDISNLEFSTPVTDMNSGLDAMDNHMRTALSINNATHIIYRLVKVNKITPNTIGGYTLQTEGELTIANNKKPIQLTTTIEIKDDIIRFFGDISLEMTTFGVTPPSAEMGSIQTENGIKVVYDMQFSIN